MQGVLRRELHLPVVLYTSQSRVWGTWGDLLVEWQEGKGRSDVYIMYESSLPWYKYLRLALVLEGKEKGPTLIRSMVESFQGCKRFDLPLQFVLFLLW